MPPEDAVLALQCVQQAAGVAILRRPAAPVERHALHAAAVEGRHQDGEHAGKAGARGQQHQMVDAVGAGGRPHASAVRPVQRHRVARRQRGQQLIGERAGGRAANVERQPLRAAGPASVHVGRAGSRRMRRLGLR
ncbi:hypothetical protein G6F57_021197 [Rhizopus arrhizus]|nr:hypothetical protein G6F57_021197 [Rhizopus arrhizus]